MEAGSYFTVHQDSDETPPAPAPRILVGPKAAVPTDVFLSKRPPKSGGALCHIHALSRVQEPFAPSVPDPNTEVSLGLSEASFLNPLPFGGSLFPPGLCLGMK